MADSSISLVAEIVIIVLGLIVFSATVVIIYMRCQPHNVKMSGAIYKISKGDRDINQIMRANSRSEVVGMRPTELHSHENSSQVFKYKATSSVARDGHRVRLLADMSSPRIDVIPSSSILYLTEKKTLGHEVWGKVEESLLEASVDYPGFDSRLHGWTLIRQMDNVFWELIFEEPETVNFGDVKFNEGECDKI